MFFNGLKSIAAAARFKTKILNTSHHSYYGWRGFNKKQTISAYKFKHLSLVTWRNHFENVKNEKVLKTG